MRSKLDPLVPSTWHELYRDADKRRRRAGWHRRSDWKSRKKGLDAGQLLALVMGLSALAVLICLAFPV
jgi:hypothetical protein